MKNLKEKKVKYIGRTIVLPVITFTILLTALVIGIFQFQSIQEEQNLILTRQEIRKAAIECYANEGRFPSGISYLEENYYLNIDYDAYNVTYDCVASNFMPDIEVFRKSKK